VEAAKNKQLNLAVPPDGGTLNIIEMLALNRLQETASSAIFRPWNRRGAARFCEIQSKFSSRRCVTNPNSVTNSLWPSLAK
jgi:hypothetical protein